MDKFFEGGFVTSVIGLFCLCSGCEACTFVIFPIQTDTRVKKEKTGLLDKHCASVKSLGSAIETNEALAETTQALYDEECAKKQVHYRDLWELTTCML